MIFWSSINARESKKYLHPMISGASLTAVQVSASIS